MALCQSSTSASIDRITWHRPESRLRHNPPRQTSRHTTNISRRIRNADYTPTARRHFTRTATLNRRMPRFRDIYRHAARGHCLSPVLFTVYLEAALRDLRSRLPTRPQTDANLPLDVEYADDTDFISTSRLFLDDIERIAPACLAEWSLTINASKTERSSVCRHADRVDKEWRMTRKLGSLLGEAGDVARRKQLANVAFRKLSTVWFRRSRISLPLRLRLYESFVAPVLIYNMGTWGLTKAELDRLDAYHRRSLATYARSSAFTGRIASRTRRFIAAVDVTPSAKTLNRRDGVCSDTCYACHGTHPLSKRSTTISPTQETPHSEGVHERLCLPR